MSRENPKETYWFRKIIGFILILIIVVAFSKFLAEKVQKLDTHMINPLAENLSGFSQSKSAAPSISSQGAKSLEAAVQSALKETNGSYSVAIKNFKTNEEFLSNEHRVYEAGSLYKLWIMAVVYQQIQAGTLSEEETLSQNIATLNNEFYITTESAELSSGTITLTVGGALHQMIAISHNYAALLLTEKIKLSVVADFLAKNGFNDSLVGTNGALPKTTSYDIALFFEKLYKGQLANRVYTDKMINLLKEQKLNNKLPKYLPEEVSVAHKTGEIDLCTHDAGIVYSPKADYLIAVLSESDSPFQAEERIAELSRNVYQYFNPRSP